MKQLTRIQPQKETMPPQMRGLLRLAAVRANPEYHLPSNDSAQTRFGHDFSQVAVRHSKLIVSQDYSNASCPLFIQRCTFGDACHNCQPRIQAKLKIRQSVDKDEQEANRVADQVMRMPNLKNSDANEYLQAYSFVPRRISSTQSVATEVPSFIHDVLNTAGQPLDQTTRDFMEPRFNRDFSSIKIHDDQKAARSAADINAEAYTVGSHIVFGKNRYDPQSTSGKHLIGHELTHVEQQAPAPGNTLQRHVLENDPMTAPSIICPVATTSVSDHLFSINFSVGGSTLSTVDKEILAGFATEWNLSSVKPTVRVDGFASIEGGPETNWPLSCDRAVAVATELHAPSIGGKPGIPVGSIEYFANGETERFSSDLAGNRVAAIHAPGVALPTSREPSVHRWATRNSGTTSPDNCAPIAPVNLGVDCDPPNFKNGIEINSFIRDHDPAYSYDVKRTLEAKYHRISDLPFGLTGSWTTIPAWNKPSGTNDDGHDSDECLVPIVSGSLHKIYSEDRPGFVPGNFSNSYNAYVSKINFIEFVRFMRSDGSTYDSSTTQKWHTITLVEKSGGNWAVNMSESEIDTGHLSSLDP